MAEPLPWEVNYSSGKMPWEMDYSAKATPQSAKAPGIVDQLKSLPAAYLDVVRHEAETGQGGPIPGLGSVGVEMFRGHPTATKVAGTLAGSLAGIPAGPAGIIAGGAAGSSIADSASQLAQMGTPQAPQSAADALLRSGGAVGEGALTGATMAGGAAGAPAALRFLASPAGGGLIAGGTTLYKTHDPLKALAYGAATATGMKAVPLGAKVAEKAIGALSRPIGAIAEAAPTIRNISLEEMPASLARQVSPAEEILGQAKAPPVPYEQAIAEAKAAGSHPADLLSKPSPAVTQTPSMPLVDQASGLPLNPDGTVTIQMGKTMLRVDPKTLGKSGKELYGQGATPSAAESLLAEARPTVPRGNPMSIGTKVSVDVGPKTYEAEIVGQPAFGKFQVKLPDGTVIERMRQNITIPKVPYLSPGN